MAGQCEEVGTSGEGAAGDPFVLSMRLTPPGMGMLPCTMRSAQLMDKIMYGLVSELPSELMEMLVSRALSQY